MMDDAMIAAKGATSRSLGCLQDGGVTDILEEFLWQMLHFMPSNLIV